MSTTYFTADLHFGHSRIIDLVRADYGSVEQMDEALIAAWNDTVLRDDDIVWVLGDYALGDRRRGLGYLSRLRGRKMLVAGNHDKCFFASSDGWKHVREYQDAGFELVAPWARIKFPPVREGEAGQKVLLSHFPYDGDHTHQDRHPEARLRDEGAPLVHGHVHELYTLAFSAKTKAPMINVGVDTSFAGGRPVSAARVAELLDQALRRELTEF